MARCLLFLALVLGAITTFTDAQRALQKCDCSPSNRGFNDNVLDFLVKTRDKNVEEATKMKEKGMTDAQVENEQKSTASVDFQACISNYDKEQCVNADAALRRGPCYPNCMVYCLWNEKTWQNINTRGEDAESCGTIPQHRSTDVKITANKPDQKPAIRPSNSPIPEPVSAEDAANGSGSEDGTAAAGEGTGSEVPVVSPAAGTNADRANEGCVAVEHLAGYKLQHTENLSRPVLCASNGFCATPNHALIIDGKWTSMRTLCASEWSCVKSVKLVNNLNVFVNRRATCGKNVVITPYDMRFPKCGVFLVQALEKMFFQHPIVTAATVLSLIFARKTLSI